MIPTGVNVKTGENPAKIPQGTLRVENQQIQLSNPGGLAEQTIPTSDSAYIVDKPTFDNAISNHQRLYQAWNGSVTLGTSLVDATQRSNMLSGSASLLRLTPQENWLDRRDRTAVNVSFAYGMLTQPNTPDVKTDIYHLDAERDEYFTSRLFAFGVILYDHNFSQGLDLQHSYGAGVGWTVVKNPDNELNLRTSVNYLKEQFQQADLNQNLIGSAFGENYMHRFAHKIVLKEQGMVTPAWNNSSAYSASGQLGLSIPLYKRFSLALTWWIPSLTIRPLASRRTQSSLRPGSPTRRIDAGWRANRNVTYLRLMLAGRIAFSASETAARSRKRKRPFAI